LYELPILIVAVVTAAAIFIPRVMAGEGVLRSLAAVLVFAGWIALIIAGFLALAFVGELPEIVRTWRTTPATVSAVRKRNALDALRKIKPERLDARAADRFGNTALHVVCDYYEEERKRDALAVIDFLLQHGADANAANTYQKTPLDLVIQHEYAVETVRRLLAAGAKPQDALNDAAGKSGKDAVEVMQALIDAGASVTLPNVLGTTPLHQAARYGTAGMIRELLARGAAIDARTRGGETPLHEALWLPSLNARRTAENVGALVAAGADRDVKDNQGRTPRELAEASGNPEIIAAMNGARGG